jgi:hypothetical protein
MRRFALQLSRIRHLASTIRRVPICVLGLLLPLTAIATPSEAADLRTAHARPIVYAPPPEPLCYWCIRDAIYVDTKLIAHLEANPDVDEADKAPWILGARADVHYLRRVLGPVETVSVAPCCYWRKRLYVR